MSNRNTFRFRIGGFHLLAIGLILTVLAIANAISAKADPITDKYAYLAALEEVNISLGTQDFALQIGHAVCEDMNGGSSLLAESRALSLHGHLTMHDAGYVVGAAATAFCPQYLPEVPGVATA